jgi:photosystem II stability/assembly factor-like uncharacterized protein
MIRVPAHVRAILRIACVGSVAALALAACGTVVVVPPVTGVPSASISVPLSSVSCTSGNSCLAVGTSNTGLGPTSVGEYRLASGRWLTLTVPTALQSTYIDTSSCWSVGCLIAGQAPHGDALWSYDALNHTVSALAGPSGGVSVAAISCFATATCGLVDFTPSSGPRFLSTTDGGATWSTPVSLSLPSTTTVSSLACGSSLDCILSTRTTSNVAINVYDTFDGGATWTQQTAPVTDSWESLTSLTCRARVCVGLAQLPTGWRIVRTATLGATWSLKSSVKSIVNGTPLLACSTLTLCVVGGSKDVATPWLATYSKHVIKTQRLKYVPSPILGLACGSKICAGIGITTVLALRP